MDYSDARDRIKARDAEELNSRAIRCATLGSISFKGQTPELGWHYLLEAEDCYVYGMFRAAVVMAGVAVEAGLREKLERRKGESAKTLRGRKLTKKARNAELLEPELLDLTDNLLDKHRNPYAHGNLEEIGKGYSFMSQEISITERGIIARKPAKLVTPSTSREKVMASFVKKNDDALKAIWDARKVLLRLSEIR